MAQPSNEHLTTAQLSAYVDKELAPDELASCNAHLPACQTCQTTLADLRLTSTLLRSLPQVEVPRSFALPSNLAVLPQTPAYEESQVRQAQPNRQIWRRTLRALSTVAAILGVLLILVGGLSGLSNTRLSSSGSAIAPSTALQPMQRQATPAASGALSPSEQHTPPATTEHTPTPEKTPDQALNPQPQAPEQQAGLPAVLDLGRTEGRLGIGAIFLVLGVLGVILTRRRMYQRFRQD